MKHAGTLFKGTTIPIGLIPNILETTDFLHQSPILIHGPTGPEFGFHITGQPEDYFNTTTTTNHLIYLSETLE